MSFDSVADNQSWAVQEGFQFELWSDTSRALALHYGAASSVTQASANRVSFLIGADGNVLLEYPTVFTGTHPQDVLEDCEALFGP